MQRTRDTFLSGKSRPLAWRINQLKQMQKLFEDNKDEFHAALKSDLRRVRKNIIFKK